MCEPFLPVAPGWLEACKAHLADQVQPGEPQVPSSPLADVTFCCRGGRRVHWGGLQYLATLCHVVPFGAGERQVIFLPDFNHLTVRKFLMLISKGIVKMTQAELLEMRLLAFSLGVRLLT